MCCAGGRFAACHGLPNGCLSAFAFAGAGLQFHTTFTLVSCCISRRCLFLSGGFKYTVPVKRGLWAYLRFLGGTFRTYLAGLVFLVECTMIFSCSCMNGWCRVSSLSSLHRVGRLRVTSCQAWLGVCSSPAARAARRATCPAASLISKSHVGVQRRLAVCLAASPIRIFCALKDCFIPSRMSPQATA